MQRWKQEIIQGAGLGAIVVCVGACLVTPIDNTTDDSESESESEGDEDSTTSEDDTNTPSNPPTNPTEVNEETGVTSTGPTTTDPTDTETETDTDTQGGVCGDGTVDRDELCDDGMNDGSYGGCTAECGFGPMCGDSNVDAPDEVCDDGVNDGAYEGCAVDCQAPGPYCGDGTVDDGEEACDDGNDVDEDGCTNACEMAICGDGIVQMGIGETCDDGVNDGSYGHCTADCMGSGPFCGDGNVDVDHETCDDTNMDNQDGCLGNCAVPQSCKQVLEYEGAAGDGVYMFAVDGTAWSAYCDMTTDGGGWTLAAKVAPTNSWQYSSARWTDNTLLSADKAGFDHTPAKLQTWNLVPFTQIHLGMEPTGNPAEPIPAYITLDVVAESLFALFSPGAYVPTTATYANWITLMPEASLQGTCDQEGVNNAAMGGDTTPRVRLGILSDDADDCSSPNSVLGVGFGNLPSPCMNNPFTSGGNLNCGSPPVKRQGFGWIFVR